MFTKAYSFPSFILESLAKNIKFENQTIYDQLCNEGLQDKFSEYLKGEVDKETAMANFYTFLNEKYPAVHTPE